MNSSNLTNNAGWHRAPMKSLLSLLLFGLLAASTAFLHTRQHCNRYDSIHEYERKSYGNFYCSTTCLTAVEGKLFGGIMSKTKGRNQSQIKNVTDPSSASITSIPYVIQKIGRGNKKEINELTRLCIDVFFNQQGNERSSGGDTSTREATQTVTPWKAVQLAYLRNSQAGDILARNAFKKNQKVEIIVARRVVDSTNENTNDKTVKYVEETDRIYNGEKLTAAGDQMTLALGEIIGYCEVIEKNFGLGDKISSGKPLPYLANLSVSKTARQSGIGSNLLDVSEEVARDWKADRMVLQVEEDNADAIRFYKKRGWQFVYADPTCRRFDTSGFFLKESRITKYAMVKQIGSDDNDSDKATKKSPVDRLKGMWFVSQ